MARRLKTTLCGMTAALCAACTGDMTVYSDIPARGWIYGTPVVMPADSMMPDVPSVITLTLTHNNDYPYRNLWLELRYTDTDSVTHTDTVRIELCDRFGRWYGNGFGASFQISESVADSRTPAPGSLMEIRHIMRVDTLRGLEKVGLSIAPDITN